MMRWLCSVLLLTACPTTDSEGGDSTGAGTSSGTMPPPGTSSSEGGSSGGSTDAESTSSPGSSSSSGGTSSGSTSGGSSTTGDGEVTFAECIEGQFVHGYPGIDFDAEGVVVGSHCAGSDHQTIEGVERVVFLGDSITVGTPPTDNDEFYRSILADQLAELFDLQFGANKALWQAPDILDGQSIALHSGDFSSCAEWGARNDDLLAGTQFTDCYPEDERDKVTLTIMTSGGNDVARMGRDFVDGATVEDLQLDAEAAVAHKRNSLEWLADEANFPNGHYIVFADVYDPSDGTGDFEDCDLSGLVGFEDFLLPPEEIMHYIQRSYAELAVETGTDLLFLHKEFCGHGHSAADDQAPCYRGPAQPIWFDFTCSHPNPEGHAELANIFYSVVTE